MHDPGTRVVSLESESKPSIGGKHCDITPSWIVVVQANGVTCRPGRRPSAKHVKVVAVQMDGMWHSNVVRIASHFLYDPVNPRVFGRKLDEVGLFRVRGVTGAYIV
jgi:hypothetical protein